MALHIQSTLSTIGINSLTVYSQMMPLKGAMECLDGSIVVPQGRITSPCSIKKHNAINFTIHFFKVWCTPSTWITYISGRRSTITHCFGVRLPVLLTSYRWNLTKNSNVHRVMSDSCSECSISKVLNIGTNIFHTVINVRQICIKYMTRTNPESHDTPSFAQLKNNTWDPLLWKMMSVFLQAWGIPSLSSDTWFLVWALATSLKKTSIYLPSSNNTEQCQISLQPLSSFSEVCHWSHLAR